ncbi:unnamed protein product [Onchocerca ochengi]|uniref:ATP-dependent DNA helicase n=1 Tax=Onchocerca ochengi TaxID=42157 RepID=A0A182E313_ONCOC|nr:unnamed protein product [Onchocerca ochengi]
MQHFQNIELEKSIAKCKLIVWDECTMKHKKSVEALDRLLQDLRSVDNFVDADEAVNHPIEFLNSLDLPRTPTHVLQLKIGMPIIMLRNINQPKFCNGTQLALKKLMERFMPNDGTFVASVFAPLMFPPVPVLVYRLDNRGNRQLVATGGVLDINPDRIILKRIVLSGHPFKINRRSVVVRYMFFNRDDIEWFKPVELRTPSGRRGHIKEALGTHGHMKCIFDQQLNAMDTVMMNLYKRVFPKWTYKPVMLYSSSESPNASELMEI